VLRVTSEDAGGYAERLAVSLHEFAQVEQDLQDLRRQAALGGHHLGEAAHHVIAELPIELF
jgi:hypothetical protein